MIDPEQAQPEPAVLVDDDRAKPADLGDRGIWLSGLAEALSDHLSNSHFEAGIHRALSLEWSYRALAQLANDLATEIGRYCE